MPEYIKYGNSGNSKKTNTI